jgi:hypothetical protein
MPLCLCDNKIRVIRGLKSIILHHKRQVLKHFGVLMTNKAPFCALLRLTGTVFTRLQIKVRPKGLHSFAFYILIFNFPPCLCGEKIREISVNPWLINDLRSTKAYVRKNILFMQNKANFRKVKFDVNQVLTTDYVQMDTWSIRKTKPIQSQSKPIQSQLKPIKANQSQNKANSNPTCRGVASGEAGNKPNFNRSTYTGNCLEYRLGTCKNKKTRKQKYYNSFFE